MTRPGRRGATGKRRGQACCAGARAIGEPAPAPAPVATLRARGPASVTTPVLVRPGLAANLPPLGLAVGVVLRHSALGLVATPRLRGPNTAVTPLHDALAAAFAPAGGGP